MKFKSGNNLLNRIISEKMRVMEFIKFAVVGTSGVFVNMGVLYLLTRHVSMNIEFASPIAIETSILTNFLVNNYWTFRRRSTRVTFLGRIFRYHLVTGLAGIVNYLILILLVRAFHMHDLLANLIGIAIGTVINFSLNSSWTWKKDKK